MPKYQFSFLTLEFCCGRENLSSEYLIVENRTTGRQIMEEIEKGRTSEDQAKPPSSSETLCGMLIMILSIFFIIITFPFSLCVCLRMVQVRFNFWYLTLRSDVMISTGIPKGCHLQIGKIEVGRGSRSWPILHHSLHGPNCCH